MSSTRRAAVSGTFYPDDEGQLSAMIAAFMAAAPAGGPAPKAVIAPHAGYVYSGAVAAHAYARLSAAASSIRRVVLIGPSHRVAFRGIAATSHAEFATPLGAVPVDQAATAEALRIPGVQVNDAAHAFEHSLEVHLPFLQTVLPEFALVPLAVGQAEPAEVARVLEALWGGPETVFVVSSDLSHYLDYHSARASDERTARAIERCAGADLDQGSACGRVPVTALLHLAERHRLAVERLDLRNSGDTAGPRDRVVGYGSWALVEPGPGATEQDEERERRLIYERHGPALRKLARTSIRHGLQFGCPVPVVADSHPRPLSDKGAAFVTLRLNGALRGCIGSPAAWRPLAVDVADNAYQAAFNDPRFPPLSTVEWAETAVSISVLTAPLAMTFRDRGDLLAQLRPRKDGLIVEDAGRRALFLPAVWDQLPDPEQFFERLLAKAGLSPRHWSPSLTARRFTNVEIADEETPTPA